MFYSPNSSQTIHSLKSSVDNRSNDGQGDGCSTFSMQEGWIRAYGITAIKKSLTEPAGFNEMCSHCTLLCLSKFKCFLNMGCRVTQKAP